MSTPVVMPQMGESIAEGTIVRWIKKVGDTVERDEPLFEISTDKVDAEIPSPAAGVLTEITVNEGETVAVNAVVATISESGSEAAAPAPSVKNGAVAAAASAQPQPDGVPSAAGPAAPAPGQRETDIEAEADTEAGADAAPDAEAGADAELTSDDVRRQKSSPLVRRIARDNNIDITKIHGSGVGGRVTKHDILEHLDSAPGSKGPGLATRDSGSGTRDSDGASESAVVTRDAGVDVSPAGSRTPGPESPVEIRPLSVMRRKIAEHMVLSRRTSAHVHTVFHVNFSTVEKIRQENKADFESRGAKLTYMAFVTKAVVDALRRYPVVNASLDGDSVVYRKDINIGIAVAMESGLIVSVIKHADEKNLLGLSRAIADVAERARSKHLKPEEVHGGTFTITNPGQFGAQFGLPIINQPQVAILGIGTIEKRPVVIDDAIGIRTMAYLALGFDHRLVDGAVADQFMADIKTQLETFRLET